MGSGNESDDEDDEADDDEDGNRERTTKQVKYSKHCDRAEETNMVEAGHAPSTEALAASKTSAGKGLEDTMLDDDEQAHGLDFDKAALTARRVLRTSIHLYFTEIWRKTDLCDVEPCRGELGPSC